MELLSGLAQGMGEHIHRPAELSDLMELLRQNVKDSRHANFLLPCSVIWSMQVLN